MRKLLLILFLLGIPLQSFCTQMIRVIPMAYNDQDGDWHVLLARNSRSKTWGDFMSRRFPCEDVSDSAERVLRSETCGYYKLNLATTPWCKRCNIYTRNEEFVVFVRVDFAPIDNIRKCACNGHKTDFIWIPANTLMQAVEGDCLDLSWCSKPVETSWGFVDMFTQMWPGVEPGFKKYHDHKMVHRYPDYPLIQEAPELKIARTSWYRLPYHIAFFRKGVGFYEFTTTYPAPFCLEGRVWPTVEHYIQAMRFPGQRHVQELIRALPSADLAVAAGMGSNPEIRGNPCPEWESLRPNLMLKASRAKFEQNPRLKALLKSTSRYVLVFDTRTSPLIDAYWGAGRIGDGRNILGQILMQIRYEFTYNGATIAPFIEQQISCFSSGYFPPVQVIATHPHEPKW